jgi:short-subunit dehydrogenase
VTLFGRSQEKLNKAKDEVLKEILDATQEISTVSVDLTDSVQVKCFDPFHNIHPMIIT